MQKFLKIGVFVFTVIMSSVSFAAASNIANAHVPPPPNVKVCAKHKHSMACKKVKQEAQAYCSKYDQSAFCKEGEIRYCKKHPHVKMCMKK